MLLKKIVDLSAAGIDWIQLREKDLSGKACTSLVEEALGGKAPAIPRAGAPPLVCKGGVFGRASAQPGERWLYCYPDDAFAEY